MANPIENAATNQKSKPMMKTGIITTGTHLGVKLIHQVAMRPLLVFGIGLTIGIVLSQKNQQKKSTCCGGSHSKSE